MYANCPNRKSSGDIWKRSELRGVSELTDFFGDIILPGINKVSAVSFRSIVVAR